MKAQWITDADGWQSLQRTDGGTDYRMLAHDAGRPSFSGSAKRYAWVYAMPDGTAIAKSAAGYSRKHASVADAKKSVVPANMT